MTKRWNAAITHRELTTILTTWGSPRPPPTRHRNSYRGWSRRRPVPTDQKVGGSNPFGRPSGVLSSTKFDDVREPCLHYDVLTVGPSIDCRVYDSRELSANSTDIPTTDGSGAGVVTSLSHWVQTRRVNGDGLRRFPLVRPVRESLRDSQIQPLSDWGSSGRRFKSCQPDTGQRLFSAHLNPLLGELAQTGRADTVSQANAQVVRSGDVRTTCAFCQIVSRLATAEQATDAVHDPFTGLADLVYSVLAGYAQRLPRSGCPPGAAPAWSGAAPARPGSRAAPAVSMPAPILGEACP
jgi:hypothetical protein